LPVLYLTHFTLNHSKT